LFKIWIRAKIEKIHFDHGFFPRMALMVADEFLQEVTERTEALKPTSRSDPEFQPQIPKLLIHTRHF